MKYRFDVLERRVCYQGFFRMDEVVIRHERYAGGTTEITREIFERGDASALLLYDPVADALVMLEQFRVGALDCPDGPWMLEVVAGIVESGETPEDVVRREALEEAGCEVDRVEFIAEFVVSPGGCSERMSLFCGRVDSRNVGGHYGLAEEGEDIRCFVMPAAQALETLKAGIVLSAITMIALQWFALNRDDLRRRWAR